MGWFKCLKRKKAKEKSYWLVHEKGLYIFECTLNIKSNTVTISNEGSVTVVSKYNPYNLFKREKDAKVRQTYLRSLYNSFQRIPYLSSSRIEKNISELRKIEAEIQKQLRDYPYFDGIDYCDVGAGGIQIRGHHKLINGYTYGGQITIKYDFSNWEECIENFIEAWKVSDTEKNVKSCKRFIDTGASYGWD